MTQTARDFFFQEYLRLPPEPYGDYNAEGLTAAGRDIFGEFIDDQKASDLHDQVRDFDMQYSNDLVLDMHVKRIRDLNEKWLPPDFLDGLFIGKVKSPFPEIYALSGNGEYTGKLVILELGLNHAINEVAQAFATFCSIRKHMPKTLGDSDQGLWDDEINLIGRHIVYAIRKLDWWKRNDYDVEIGAFDHSEIEALQHKYQRPIDRVLAMGVATNADQFLIAHELAHHLLEHTGQYEHPLRLGSMHGFFEEMTASQLGISVEQAQELCADSWGLILLCGGKDFTKHRDTGSLMEICFGTFIALTTIGLLQDDPDSAIGEYIQPQKRFAFLAGLLELNARQNAETHQTVEYWLDELILFSDDCFEIARLERSQPES